MQTKTKPKTSEALYTYIRADRPIIYINHFDSKEIDDVLGRMPSQPKIIEFNNALGYISFETKTSLSEELTLESFLALYLQEVFNERTLILLKDIHNFFINDKVIALLKLMADKIRSTKNYKVNILIVSAKLVIPAELEHMITLFQCPLPKDAEINEIIEQFCKEVEYKIDPKDSAEIARALVGLNGFQINQTLRYAYLRNTNSLNFNKTKEWILQEKEQIVKKSGKIEYINSDENIENIGGLENLIEWLKRKQKIIQDIDKAIHFCVAIPKGLMIVGMPGCGKSLAAKAAAKLFGIPLLRLDVGRLMGKYVGESEENMRQALSIAEASSPCVIWIDEIEKAFAGLGGSGGGSDVTTRLFGHFLTWMQDKENSPKNTVFVVATANDISHLPAEFLRKGRFDEVFFVDFPNEGERKKIFEIHLKKRNRNEALNLTQIAQMTSGYCGADIEAVVLETIEHAFLENRKHITQDDLLTIIKDTKSISVNQKAKIDTIRKGVKEYEIRPASKP
ncbi:MAG: AAA family ATPase [Holophagales bacterium]|jgi:SpoVK/Ycf46/Vps4 family AAA+-type ATPase|nr:AAA family ATPase [Holophagales bacterium]